MIIDTRYFLIKKIEKCHEEIVKKWKFGYGAIEEIFDKMQNYSKKLEEVVRKYEETS